LLKVALRHPKNQIKSSYNAKCLYKKDDLSWGSTLVVLHQKSGLIRWSLLGVAWWGRRFGSGLMREEAWEWSDEGGGLGVAWWGRGFGSGLMREEVWVWDVLFTNIQPEF
jgi:hypothetical protein